MPGIVAFTGAGISAPSGIPVFRGHGVRWEHVMPIPSDTFFSLGFLQSQPERLWELYLTRLIPALRAAAPNAAHRALARWQIPVITQNIDWLHEAAGSREVLHLHGHAGWVRCAAGHRHPIEIVPAWDGSLPRCPDCRQMLRPDVVFFGEPVQALPEAAALAAGATELIVVGTSLRVYPANGVVFEAQARGVRVHLIDAECERRVTALLEHLLGPAPAAG
ncbi:MAG TPA: Sir2 family NAD-dependent protein deacetylase [Limnochordia bacterium]